MTAEQTGAATITSWFIDPVNGKDTHLGTVDAHGTPRPLRTHEELRRRLGDRILQGDVEVTLLGDFGPDNPVIVDFTLGAGATLTYRGAKELTVLHSGTFTNVVPIDPSLNQAQEVEDASLAADWGPSGLVNSSDDLPAGALRRIRITGGERAGAIAYACADLKGKRARTSPFGFPANVRPTPPPRRLVTPQVGDPFSVESGFVLIDSFAVDIKISPVGKFPPGKIYLWFIDLELNPGRAYGHQLRARAEGVFGGPGTIAFAGCGLGRLTPQYANKVGFDFCRLGGMTQAFQATLVQVIGCCCLSHLVCFEGARIVAYAHTIFQGNPLRIKGLARLGEVGFFDSPGVAGLQVEQGGTAQVEKLLAQFEGGQAVYGAGNQGFGAKVRAGGCLVYDHEGKATPADAGITLTGDGGDVDVAGTPGSWATIAPDLAPAGKRAAVAWNE